MRRTVRLSAAWVVLLILAVSSLSCSFVTNLLSPQDRQDQREQQNQPNQQNQLNPDQNQQPDQEFGPAQNQTFDLAGIWESQTETSQGTVYTELILEYTGTFSQSVTWNNLMTLDTGEYNVIGNAIHFTVTHHEPTEYLGQQLTWPTSFTYFITPIDATSMTVEDHIMNTSWTMYKTGP
jgi:hypothetical protein